MMIASPSRNSESKSGAPSKASLNESRSSAGPRGPAVPRRVTASLVVRDAFRDRDWLYGNTDADTDADSDNDADLYP
jgi:hypothetical protein